MHLINKIHQFTILINSHLHPPSAMFTLHTVDRLLEKFASKNSFQLIQSFLNKQMDLQWVTPSLLHYQTSGWSKWNKTS